MARKIFGVAIAAALLGAWGGYRFGATAWPFDRPAPMAEAPAPPRPLYWKDPDAGLDFSDAPKKTNDGREYLPVYDDQERPLEPSKPQQAKHGGKILYYRNPMGLADTSPVPKKDGMGMDYAPVYEGDEPESGGIKISLDRVQRSGVRSEAIAYRRIGGELRAPAIAKPNERALRSVSLRADGFIEKLLVNAVGQDVTIGETMFIVYSPQMVSVQVDYRNAVKAGVNPDEARRGGEQRLRNMGVPEAVIAQLAGNSDPRRLISWPSPATGVVLIKNVVEGQMARAGEELYRLADLTTIWAIADVPEQDLARVSVGAPVKLSFIAFPGEIFEGRVTFILHELEPATRTAKIRIEMDNPHHRVRHEMYAEARIESVDATQRLAAPLSAIIDSGARRYALIDRGDGRFEPRAVKLGARDQNFVEILEGVEPGEKVVTSANFLIDSEINLRQALRGFTADAPEKADAPQEAEKRESHGAHADHAGHGDHGEQRGARP